MSDFDNLIKEAGLVKIDHSQPPADPAPVEEVITTAPAEVAADPTPAPVAPDKYKILSETFGREFKSDDDIDTYKGSLTSQEQKLAEWETKEAAWTKEKEELAKGIDPMQYFASPELFTLNGLLKKFPDKNPLALTQISTQDFSKSYLESPVDVLALDLMLENPGIYQNKADAIEDVYARYNVDDPDEIDAKAKRRMQVDAKTATDKFDGIKKQIEIPKTVDLSAEKAARVKANEDRITKMTEATNTLFSKTIPGALNEVTIPTIVKGEDGKDVTEVAFKYEIPESYAKSKDVQAVLQQVRNSTIQNEAEWTPEKEAKLKESTTKLLLALYWYDHRVEIDAARVTDLEVKFKDEAWMKRHNVRPLRQDGTAPRLDPGAAKLEQQQAKFLKEQGIKV